VEELYYSHRWSQSAGQKVAHTLLKPHPFGFHHRGYVNKASTVKPQKALLRLQDGIRNALAPDTPETVSSVKRIGVMNRCLLSEKCSTY
jgi:hypothetical protein